MTDETKAPEETRPPAPEPTTPEEVEAYFERLDAFFKVLVEKLQGVMDTVIEKRKILSYLYVTLLRGSLGSLKHHIEDPEVLDVSWENPWTELHYPVEWDWEGMDLVHVRPEDFSEEKLAPVTDALKRGEDPFKVAPDAVQALALAMLSASIMEKRVLLGLTHSLAVHIKGGEEAGYFFLDPKVKADLDALPTEEERAVRWGELWRPFSIGAFEEDEASLIPLDTPWGKDTPIVVHTPEDYAPTTTREWTEIEKEAKDLPTITFSGEVNGVTYQGSVVIMFHPLVVDEDKREAYFPIVTGLAIVPAPGAVTVETPEGEEPIPAPTSAAEYLLRPAPEGWEEAMEKALSTVNPGNWSEEDRADLWKSLLIDLPKKLLVEMGVPQEEASQEIDAAGMPGPDTTRPEVKVPEPAPPVPPEEAPSVLISGTTHLSAALAKVKSAGSPPPERRPPTVGLAFGPAPMSVQALNIAREAHRVSLPKKWSTLPRWEKLKEDEVQALLEEEGPRAFEDLRKTTKDPEERGPLLRRVTKGSGKEEVVLTAEGQDRLRRRAGLGRGFLDLDRYGQERLYRFFEVGSGGLLEVGLSWQGLAGPLVEEWRTDLKRQAETLSKDLKKDSSLFMELDEERRGRVDRLLSQIRLWEDGRRVMEVILGQVGKQRRNPVEIPAEAFRVLLWPKKARTRDWPQDWKQRVDGALTALNALTFSVKTYHAGQVKGYGSMVGQWLYKGLGPGAHGDGVYVIDVSSGFIGCLHVFQSGKQRLRSGSESVSFHFSKDLTPEERKALGWGKGLDATDTFVSLDVGRTFYSAAAGLSATQENLLRFLESNVTLRKDFTRPETKASKVKPSAPDAHESRLYTSAFCPLLPRGEAFHGALGHFKKNPEAGFTLGGTESRAARHPGGLLYHMGHVLPSGSARSKRAEVITKALEDLKAVVVDYLGGRVVGHDGANWIPFEGFRVQDERTLTKGLRIFFFLPETWEEKRRAQWEETTGRRATEDPEEAERETWEAEVPVEALGDEVASEENAFQGLPLHRRLGAMMQCRKLLKKDLAALFGVSKMTASKWIAGTLKVSSYLVPLVVRWIETGEAPTEDELAAFQPRRHTAGGRPRRGRR